MDSNRIRSLLNSLAVAFEDAVEAPDETEGEPADAAGWGQFLDARRQHKQLGLYGTSAGLMVLALAGRGEDSGGKNAASLMAHWWSSRADPSKYSHKKLVQIPRLAFENLALRLSDVPQTKTVSSEFRHVILDEVLPAGLWGNYWLSNSNHDNTPRVFPSALVLLSFTAMVDGRCSQDGRLLRATQELERRFTVDLPVHEAAAAAAALLSAQGTSASRMVRSVIGELAIARSRDIGEGGVYFYDYEYTKPLDGAVGFGRDYFIVPTEILLGIAGFQEGAPRSLRGRAEQILDNLATNIEQNSGRYLSSDQRIASKNQAWAALLLGAALRAIEQRYKPAGRVSRMVYGMRRTRSSPFFDTWFPFLSMLVVTVLGVAAKDIGGVVDGIVAVAVLLIGGLYGPAVVRRLFPGYRAET